MHHKKLVRHRTQPTIGQAANLHFTSVFVKGDTAQELAHSARKSALHSLFRNRLKLEHGRTRVPTDPGLGLELDESELSAMVK